MLDFSITLRPIDEDEAQSRLSEFRERVDSQDLTQLSSQLSEPTDFSNNLAAIFSLSPYLFDCACRHPHVIHEVATLGFDGAFEAVSQRLRSQPLEAENEVAAGLRRAKAEVALLCGLADLTGGWPTLKVTAALSEFAADACQTSLRFLFTDAARNGQIKASWDHDLNGCGYFLLAMGKLGANELNYSSDIDLIALFDLSAPIVRELDDPGTFFMRLTKRLVKLLQERTADGYVFRTDLRLRPDPGSTPLAVSTDGALTYYESRGQNWERAAMIKARPIAGDCAAGAQFLFELSPFIWRKYLDYAAIDDVHSIKRQIHAHKGHGEVRLAGHNVKLGRGGIREIEFFVQTQQLIAGGRIEALRGRSTLETLATLAELDWITSETAQELTESYLFLRDVEHRLQMVRDEQVHSLPSNDDGLLRIARMCGMPDVEAFSERLLTHLRRVELRYSELFEDARELAHDAGNLVFTGDVDDPGTLENLYDMGFERPSVTISIIRGWHYGRYKAIQTAAARERLTELTPALLDAFRASGKPDETLAAFDRFAAGLPAGVQLFALMRSNPKILELLVLVLSAAPRLSTIITRKPHIFDGLLEPGFFTQVPDADWLRERLLSSLSFSTTYEEKLNRARIFAAEQKFLIGVRVLTGSMAGREAGRAFTALADVLCQALLDVVVEEFSNIHGHVPQAQIALLGMGRLGSRELTAGSDLDIILLYDHPEDASQSDGQKPLATSQYFMRLTQRLIAAMSAPTEEGTIYELDFRLRPSGNAGPLATHIAAFESYQTSQAWTWEHMALTRARAIGGHIELCERVNGIICEIVQKPRIEGALKTDIRDMRKRIERDKPPQSRWDLKLAPGGLIDLEFIAQWLMLSGRVAGEPGADVEEIINEITDSTLQNDKMKLLSFVRTLGEITQLIRVCLDEGFDPATAPPGLVERLLARLDLPDVKSAEAELMDLQSEGRAVFERLLS
ncbi:MAG: bifunctional [glutamine synthetase] adenylyltransferase/[glutamine synthetase]-adenylyl-L-tyrosine phosphorylase [Pseudomonadota bacterium]